MKLSQKKAQEDAFLICQNECVCGKDPCEALRCVYLAMKSRKNAFGQNAKMCL